MERAKSDEKTAAESPYGSGVGARHDLVLGVKRKHRHQWAKYLVGDELHVVGTVGINRWQHEVAGGQDGIDGITTNDLPCPRGLRYLHVSHYLFPVLGAHQRSDHGVGIEGVTDRQRPYSLGDRFEELLVDAALDEHPGCRSNTPCPVEKKLLVNAALSALSTSASSNTTIG